ncbi:MAG: AAA family ATPase, partial [Dehalococcoidia bacterium]|nr:AAA family ATPase [Dehalococcoidia bacterium]
MEKMQIVLKHDWDIPLQSPTAHDSQKVGHFAGRDTEVSMLSNEILRKDAGSILVSGYRGVGKTSLVYKSLYNAIEKDKNLIVVLLNAAQLDAETTTELDESKQKHNKIVPKKIIENLIRRLYSKTKSDTALDKKIQDKINPLYRKTVADEFKSSQVSQTLQKDLSVRVTEKRIFGYISSESFQKFLFAMLIIIVAYLQLTPAVYPWIKIISLLLLIPSPFFVSFVTNKLSSQSQTDSKKLEAEEMYKFDNSIGNLEFDLEEIHKELKSKNKKLVYVIDEMDKLELEQIKYVLKFFKNLFTLSGAIFIFIGDNEIYNLHSGTSGSNKSRPKEYTYFTSKYFISRPLWGDLSTYLDSIIKEHNLPSNNLEVFKRALCFDAQNDFFDLRTFVKDCVVNFDSNYQPIIEFSENTYDNIKKARMHKAVTVLFEQNYMSNRYSKWQENEELHKYLFEHAKTILASKVKTIFSE